MPWDFLYRECTQSHVHRTRQTTAPRRKNLLAFILSHGLSFPSIARLDETTDIRQKTQKPRPICTCLSALCFVVDKYFHYLSDSRIILKFDCVLFSNSAFRREHLQTSTITVVDPGAQPATRGEHPTSMQGLTRSQGPQPAGGRGANPRGSHRGSAPGVTGFTSDPTPSPHWRRVKSLKIQGFHLTSDRILWFWVGIQPSPGWWLARIPGIFRDLTQRGVEFLVLSACYTGQRGNPLSRFQTVLPLVVNVAACSLWTIWICIASMHMSVQQ